MKIPTSERLAQVLESHGLHDMAKRARECYYDDFQSPLATPIAQLVLDLFTAKQEELAKRAMNGEWDGTKEEGELWWAVHRHRSGNQ